MSQPVAPVEQQPAPPRPAAPRGVLRVGISVAAGQAAQGLWGNGILQNAIFLCMALQACENVRSACLVDVGADAAALPPQLEGQPLHGFDAVCERLDVLIELGAQVSAAQTEILKRRGTRLVSYCCGSEYVVAMEAVLFGRPLWAGGLFINQRYDAIWMVPQVAETNRGFFEVLRQRQAEVVPFVWDPLLLERRSAGLRAGGAYRPRRQAARLSVMEPNVDVVKFCLYPLLIAEQAHRCSPGLIGFIHVTNCERFAGSSQDFVALMNHLDLVRQHKAAFVGRFETPSFLSEMTDAVVSHQWGNPLNYLYLEVCWQGYPLIHNAELCRSLGYYYPGHDVRQGARVLQDALLAHDGWWQAYRERQRAIISRYRPHHPGLLRAYARLLDELMQRPLH